MSIKKLYVGMSLLVLAVSTVMWSLAAARLGQGNADQLVDGFLFENAQTFSGAQFPASHTQLVKWPIFWLLGMVHNARPAYILSTVLLSLLTVGLLAWLVYRIHRRPLVFGTVCLGLACILVMVPAQVQGNLTAPLSMAMITGRNIEYMVYIACLILFIRANTAASWKWGSGVLLLGLLVASDRLFLPVTLVGGLALGLIAYASKQSQLSALARRWLLGSGVAWLISGLLLWVIKQFCYVVGSNSPYDWVNTYSSLHPAMTGLLKGLLLNNGITTAAGGLTAVTAVINAALAGVALYAITKVMMTAWKPAQALSAAQLLTIMLALSSVVTVIFFVIVNHPYTADARYLMIVFFTSVIAVATYARHIKLPTKYYYATGGILVAAVAIGVASVVQHTSKVIAGSELSRRNALIAQALAAHPEQILVGDYWRVVPIKALSKQADQQIMPLTACAQPRQVLTSLAWNKRLETHSFAYLLPIVPTGTPYGTCTLGSIEFLYGPPTSVMIIAGTARSPAELLLFYNDGAADSHGRIVRPPKPVLGAPTEGEAKPTGSMMMPLIAPS